MLKIDKPITFRSYRTLWTNQNWIHINGCYVPCHNMSSSMQYDLMVIGSFQITYN